MLNMKKANEDKKIMQSDVSFSTKELNTWVNAGLIDKSLLIPERINELYRFIRANQDKLFNHFKEDFRDDSLQVLVPCTQEGLEAADTLTVVNKKTQKNIRTLDKVMFFGLIYGVNLKIKAREINDWKKVKDRIHKLTKEQLSSFLQAFSEMAITTEGIFQRKDIIKIIDKILKQKKQPRKVRQSGHYVDSKLQYPAPDKQLPTKELAGTVKVFGINLTPSEDKLMNVIYKLLHDKSVSNDITSDLFYTGNEPPLIIPYGDKQEKVSAPMLRIKPSELYKEYLGKNDYSGKEIKTVKTLLLGLNEKKFLIRYDRKRKVIRKNKEEEILTDRIEEYRSLLRIQSFIEGLTEKEIKRLDCS